MTRRFTEEQIIAILREADAAPTNAEVCRPHGISAWTFYRCQRAYRGLEVDQLRRLKQLVGEQALAHQAVTAILEPRGLRCASGARWWSRWASIRRRCSSAGSIAGAGASRLERRS